MISQLCELYIERNINKRFYFLDLYYAYSTINMKNRSFSRLFQRNIRNRSLIMIYTTHIHKIISNKSFIMVYTTHIPKNNNCDVTLSSRSCVTCNRSHQTHRFNKVKECVRERGRGSKTPRQRKRERYKRKSTKENNEKSKTNQSRLKKRRSSRRSINQINYYIDNGRGSWKLYRHRRRAENSGVRGV